MQPVKQALRELRRHGFERLALVSLAPPTPNDDAFRATRANLGLPETPSHATLSWRTKCALVANTVLSSIARDTDVLFIDRWSDQVRNGVALPGLLDDWMHLSTWASDATALAIIERFDGVPSRPQLPPANYQVYVEDPSVVGGMREHTIDHADFHGAQRRVRRRLRHPERHQRADAQLGEPRANRASRRHLRTVAHGHHASAAPARKRR